jgi:FkbM family methyltransferase
MNYYGHKGLDKFLYEKYFLNKHDGIAMEAGALDGLSLSTCKTLEEIGWKCINIEPNPNEFEKLVINRPLSLNLNVGLSHENGISLFEVAKKVKNGHLTGPSGVLDYLRTPGRASNLRFGTVKFEVKIMTYKKIIEDYKINKLDLLVLDVEGWEPQAIRGMADCNVLPDILCVESCPSILKVISYEQVIADVFGGRYKKDSSCWLNDIYIRS